MKTLELIRSLRETSGKNAKVSLVAESKDKFFLALAQKTCDVLLTYGIKAIPESTGGIDGKENIDAVMAMLTSLENRYVTGAEAKEMIQTVMECTDKEIWNELYRPILMKDLKCGMSANSINKAVKLIAKEDDYDGWLTFLVPERGCQLAKSWGDVAELNHKGKKMVDYKLDGVRIYTILDKEKNTVTMHTRNGAIKTNFSYVTEELFKLMQVLPESCVLDGEIMSGEFNNLMKQLNRKGHVDTSGAVYWLFDYIPLKEFMGTCVTPQSLRHAMLERTVSSYKMEKVFAVEKEMVDLDTEEGRQRLEEINEYALEKGFEGVMLKNPNSAYTKKKNASWLKKKPVLSVDLRIIGMEEADDDSKYAGMLGAFICEGEDLGKKIHTKVGSGFNDEQRKEFWEHRDELIGTLVEIETQELTLAQDSTVHSLRFPVFIRFREETAGSGKL